MRLARMHGHVFVMFLIISAGRAAAADYLCRAETLYSQSRFDEALVELSSVLRQYPQDPRALFLRARAYYQKGDFVNALADLEKGIVRAPHDAQAYYNRAVVYYSLQDYDSAWEDVRRARSLGYRLDPAFFEQLKEDTGRAE